MGDAVLNRCIEVLSRMLSREERDAVLGDLLESKESVLPALLGVGGLIARRQAALWRDWRPWLVLVGMVGVICPVLTVVSFAASQPLIRELICYSKVGLFYTDGTLSAQDVLTAAICLGLGLAFSSLLCGAALARMAQKTLWLTGALYFLIWTIPLPAVFSAFREHLRGRFELKPFVVFELTMQAIFHVLFFALPSLLGLRLSLLKRSPDSLNS